MSKLSTWGRFNIDKADSEKLRHLLGVARQQMLFLPPGAFYTLVSLNLIRHFLVHTLLNSATIEGESRMGLQVTFANINVQLYYNVSNHSRETLALLVYGKEK